MSGQKTEVGRLKAEEARDTETVSLPGGLFSDPVLGISPHPARERLMKTLIEEYFKLPKPRGSFRTFCESI